MEIMERGGMKRHVQEIVFAKVGVDELAHVIHPP